MYEFRMPDIGEGVAEGEIVKWMASEGEMIKEDQPLVEVMTDKVNVQIPAPRTGKIARILVKEGEVAKVGQALILIDDGGETSTSAQSVPHQTPTQYASELRANVKPNAGTVLAAPVTRKLARELGVDISSVSGSGNQGKITDDDVRRAASQRPSQVMMPSGQGLIEETVPLRGIRRTIAEHMMKSKQATAQVTHVDEVDMTNLVLIRDALKGSAEKKGVKLTYIPFIIKALVPALKAYPYVNASLDEQSGNVTLKKYYNIGIATDTEQGLVVPVLKDADKKDIFELAGEIDQLVLKARSGKLTLGEVKGSTFTITNLGAIGGLFATPIINYPEAAILGVYKISKRPVVREGGIEIRDMTYLSLSFDHRVLDGAYAARFTANMIETIQDTKKLLSEVL